MNKISKLAAIAVVALMSSVASAEYLYCMIKDANCNGNDVNFDFARVKVDGGDYLFFYSPGQASSTSVEMLSDPQDNNSSYWASQDVGFYAGEFEGSEEDTYVTFLFELWLGDNQVAWQTAKIEWDDESIVGTTIPGGAKALVVSDVIPEPTSGLLLLLGMAGLALCRRQGSLV